MSRQSRVARAKASRDARSKAAKAFINQTIPAILRSNARARRGVESVELIISPPLALDAVHSDKQVSVEKPPPQSGEKEPREGSGATAVVAQLPTPGLRISLLVADTLEAASRLVAGSQTSNDLRVVILNMASPLRPGGGVLSGASSQEEWICARTTLYVSLHEEFYRLPEVGAVFTPDVLVCRHWDNTAAELAPRDRFFVDVITAAMLRLPDLERNDDGIDVYSEAGDRELVLEKMRAVMRILRMKNAKRVVLGAWGCGAYRNPVGEIARGWRTVLLGGRAKRMKREGKRTAGYETWGDMEIVFAIKDRRMAEEFARAFGPEMDVGNEFDAGEEGNGEGGEDHSSEEDSCSDI